MTKKYCTKCGKPFEAIGREVICPSCKAEAAEETKRAAVLRAKKASWAGESVPVRISGRASTVIRAYGKAHDVPFAQALDALLQSTAFAANLGDWEDITPYKSRRRDKHTAADNKQDVQDVPQDAPQAGKPQEVKTAAKTTNKSTTSTSKAVGKNASKAVKTSTAGKEGKA